MIARTPHPVFAGLWLVLVGLALVAGIRGPSDPWFALSVGLAILLVEAVGVAWRQERRDTLSEITTWVNRKLSKHGRALRGWNTLIAIQAMILGRLVYVIVVGFGGAEAQWFGVALGVLLALGQHDHWLHPTVNG